ncbi:hypothetical protein MesoLj131b_28560 [Mesorhizobium sp. 131-2-5]|nr:hypothetical protein MesoLj131b_28560 [Mesorhizobium sp. 131-2-5]
MSAWSKGDLRPLADFRLIAAMGSPERFCGQAEGDLLCTREGLRQAEFGQDRLFEGGHGADSVAGESQHEEA